MIFIQLVYVLFLLWVYMCMCMVFFYSFTFLLSILFYSFELFATLQNTLRCIWHSRLEVSSLQRTKFPLLSSNIYTFFLFYLTFILSEIEYEMLIRSYFIKISVCSIRFFLRSFRFLINTVLNLKIEQKNDLFDFCVPI